MFFQAYSPLNYFFLLNYRDKTLDINPQQDNVFPYWNFFIFIRYKNNKLTDDP